MEEYRKEQIEALQVAVEYCEKLISGIQNVYIELTEEKLEDTDEYLQQVLKGINWVIEIFNATKDILQESGVIIDKEAVNPVVAALNDAIDKKEEKIIAEILNKDILTFLQDFKKAGEIVIK